MRRMSSAMDLPLPRSWGVIWGFLFFVRVPGSRRTLLHRGIIRWTHIHFVHVIFSIHLFYDLAGLFPILRKGRVGMKSVPILFRFFPAGMGHDVDEGVSPGRILVGHPVADDIEIVLVL